MGMVSWVAPVGYAARILVFVAAIVIMGLGISLTVYGDVMVLPAEGLVQAIVHRFSLDFGISKIVHDCTMVVITVVISFAGLGYLYGIGIGTFVAAGLLGPIARNFMRCFEKLWVQPAGTEIGEVPSK